MHVDGPDRHNVRRADGPWGCGVPNKRGKPCLRIPAKGSNRCPIHEPGWRCERLPKRRPADKLRALVLDPDAYAAPLKPTVEYSDARVLDLRQTIAAQLSLIDRVWPMVGNTQPADALIQQLRDSGLPVDGDCKAMLRQTLDEVFVERAMMVVDRLARVGRLQVDALRLKAIADLVLQRVQPEMEEFAAQVVDAARELVPQGERAELERRLRASVIDARDRLVHEIEVADRVTRT